jgi:Zn ribbon nucleic-acid-binding protein
MAFQDKSVMCIDCGFAFVFSGADQEYYRSRGYLGDPKRCPSCKENRQTQAKKPAPSMKNAVSNVTCVRCGKDTSVPVHSHTVSPMYCNNCCVETGLPVNLGPGQEAG